MRTEADAECVEHAALKEQHRGLGELLVRRAAQFDASVEELSTQIEVSVESMGYVELTLQPQPA